MAQGPQQYNLAQGPQQYNMAQGPQEYNLAACRSIPNTAMAPQWAENERGSPRSSSFEEIIKLMVMRERARSAKDWSLADSIRLRLSEMGVTLFDKTSTWRSNDGMSGRIPSWSQLEAGETPESIIAAQATKMQTAGGHPEAHRIKALVQQREQARSAKDFARCDEIREELRAIGVEVFDKEKMWRAKNGASGVVIGFHGPNGPTDLEIATLVVQREKARQASDFGTADMIRDELKAVGVEIYDKEKLWRSSDGRRAPVPSWSQIQSGSAVMSGGGSSMGGPGMTPQMQAMMPPPWVSGGGGPGSPQGATAATLQTQVVQAALAAAQTPQGAVRTLQMLHQPYAAGAGRGQKGGMAPVPPSPEAQEALRFISNCQATGRMAQITEIDWLVGIREKCRQSGDYASADTLRSGLRSALGVELQEKDKKWVTSDGRYGSIPMWTNMPS
mmetsp:Transcript_118933/g.237036  ORF Transcript_118933/g.237036 Transcript_118933/m.237036 type:complete len:445 (-) Transcript_118933:58-1392(-)